MTERNEERSVEDLRSELRELARRLEEEDDATHEATEPAVEEARENVSLDGSTLPQLVAMAAKLQLDRLVGLPVESVVGIEPEEGGWRVMLDVLELEKIPQTADVLATYEVELDRNGELRRFERIRRYVRGNIEYGR